MAILRNRTQGNYTLVSSGIVHDTSLSIDERGLLLTLLSLPDNWNLSIKGLCAILPDGKDKIAKIMKNLEKKGYLIREQRHLASGRFDSNYIEVLDSPKSPKNTDSSPCPENPDTVKPNTAKPSSVNPPQYNIQEIKNQKINNTTSSPRTHTRTRRRDDEVSPDKSSLQEPAQSIDSSDPVTDPSVECASHVSIAYTESKENMVLNDHTYDQPHQETEVWTDMTTPIVDNMTADSQLPPDTVSALKELGLSDRDIKAVFHSANEDKDKIIQAIHVLKTQPCKIKSVTGWLISAIQQEYSPPIQCKPQSTQNFAASRDYDFVSLEAKLLNRQMSGSRTG